MRKTAIYAGHGGADSGAVGQNGELEKDYTLKIAAAAINALNASGYETITNRTSDVSRDIADDANTANSTGVDYVVEIHLNSNSGTPATGTEVYYSITGGKGKELAENILNEITALGYKSRGIKTKKGSSGKDYFGIIRRTTAPAVLIEVCFINNPDDMSRLDCDAAGRAIASGILKMYGDNISDNAQQDNTASGDAQTASGDGVIRNIQSAMNDRYGCGIAVDGIYGPKTKKALVTGLQTELNTQFGRGLTIDGIWGPKTKAACVTVRKNAEGNITYILQAALYCNGFNPGNIDGIFEDNTFSAVKRFQSAKGISVDGVAGKNTFEKLMG